MKKLLLAFAACAASVCGFAANHEITDLSTLPTTFFFEGDTVVLPADTYTVMGDLRISVKDNVMTCKQAGFTLIKNSAGTSYRVNVAPVPKDSGDVFYLYYTSGDKVWTTASWTKLTSNSDRTYPNNPHDVAMIFADTSGYTLVQLDAAIKLHGLVQAMQANAGHTIYKNTLTLCGTADDPAWWAMSYPSTQEKGPDLRIGKESGSESELLTLVSDSPVIEFRLGDCSSASTFQHKAINAQICSAEIIVEEGQVLAIQGGCAQLARGKTSYGHFSGSGIIRQESGSTFFGREELLRFPGDVFTGELEVCAGASMTADKLPPNMKVRCVGGGTSGDQYAKFSPSAGGFGYMSAQLNYSANPGNFTPGTQIYLEGGSIGLTRQQTTSWGDGIEDPVARQNAVTTTNEFSLALGGEGHIYGYPAHDASGTYVRPGLFLNGISHGDHGDLAIFGFNFNNDKADTYNFTRGIAKFVGEGLKDVQAELKGSLDGAGDNPDQIYQVVPWLVVKCNRSGSDTWADWSASVCFPVIGSDGIIYPPFHPDCPGGAKKMTSSVNISAYCENSVAYVTESGSSDALKLYGDRTVNALAFRTNRDGYYAWGYKGYLGSTNGKGNTLTITSGGLIVNGVGVGVSNGLGGPQIAGDNNMKNGKIDSGKVVFGARAYVFDYWGRVAKGDTSHDYDCIWSECSAPYGFVKAGIGELCLARDQSGIKEMFYINSGKIWLGYPGPYLQTSWLYAKHPESCDGCHTDVDFFLHAGTELGVPSPGYDVNGDGVIGDDEKAISREATITLKDSRTSFAKIEIAEGADQTCKKLYISGRNKGKALKRGTYGTTESGADYKDDVHFAGTGVLTVLKDDAAGMYLIIR